MSAEIAEIGNAILRRHAEPVCDFTAMSLTEAIDNMTLLMNQRQGVGIAAPQISVSQQILIIASKPNKRYPDAPLLGPLVMLNPEIVIQSEETDVGWEGCLSVPNIRGLVTRSVSVDVVYYDRQGERQQISLEGFPARIFLHEYDHLIGLTFLDRVASTKDIISEKEFFLLQS
ncbi:peptide deformylase [Gammaproteobacteria bacterium 45_16_T64]|nr:peptide deformylase [Gammaproteobacteria bacterium 45_16_T64]